MAENRLSCDHADDEYIYMEVSSFSNLLCHSKSSPPHPREFEFQMSSATQEREPTTSPADELFYKGKLLPLHLPPRLQMVEKLLHNSNPGFDKRKDIFEEFYSTPLATTATTPLSATPFESCNISPAESCRVSGELNPDEYISEYSTDVQGLSGENSKKSWAKKLKKSSIGLKLKASTAYLKSFFSKSGCSHESCTAATQKADGGSAPKDKESMSRFAESKKNPLGQIQKDKCSTSTSIMRRTDKEKTAENGVGNHRRSFSVVIKRHSTKNSSSSSSSGSSSSSSSNNSKGFQELQFLKRCSSSSSDIEISIQGAIAYCKQSQQRFHSRKTASEVGFFSLSTSRIAVREEQEKPDLCRG